MPDRRESEIAATIEMAYYEGGPGTTVVVHCDVQRHVFSISIRIDRPGLKFNGEAELTSKVGTDMGNFLVRPRSWSAYEEEHAAVDPEADGRELEQLQAAAKRLGYVFVPDEASPEEAAPELTQPTRAGEYSITRRSNDGEEK